jgi:signal transduction histidine kinase
MIKNLFLNAVNHNVENGMITVMLKEKSLVFSNTGVANPLNADKLFERFSKIDPSSKGNGLGLSIVKKIVGINSWRIEYRFENNRHVFEIHF